MVLFNKPWTSTALFACFLSRWWLARLLGGDNSTRLGRDYLLWSASPSSTRLNKV
jgi:hypothetical protein